MSGSTVAGEFFETAPGVFRNASGDELTVRRRQDTKAPASRQSAVETSCISSDDRSRLFLDQLSQFNELVMEFEQRLSGNDGIDGCYNCVSPAAARKSTVHSAHGMSTGSSNWTTTAPLPASLEEDLQSAEQAFSKLSATPPAPAPAPAAVKSNTNVQPMASWHEALIQGATQQHLQAMVAALQVATGAQSVLVTLLDEDCQRILANSSIPGECVDGVTQTTHEESICKVVFSEVAPVDRVPRAKMGQSWDGQVREVLDTQEDKELCDAPLVCGGPNIRYYYGVELVKNQAYICFLDDRPGRPAKMRSEKDFERFTHVVCSLRQAFIGILQADEVFRGVVRANMLMVSAVNSFLVHEKEKMEKELKAQREHFLGPG